MNQRNDTASVRSSRPLWAFAALSVAALTAGGVVLTGLASAATTAPPYEPDASSVGSIYFYDANGTPITGGSVSTPISAYVVDSAAVRASDTKATLYGYLPIAQTDPKNFSGELMAGPTTFPVTTAAAPAIVKSSKNPTVAITASDATIGDLASDYPNKATDPTYMGLYQLRVLSSGTAGTSQTYESVDIRITGSTWAVVYPDPATNPAPVTSPSASPSSSSASPSASSASPSASSASPSASSASPSASSASPSASSASPSASSASPSASSTSPSASASPSVSSTSPTPSSTSTVSDVTIPSATVNGSALGFDPTLTPGTSVTITGRGFSPNATVAVVLGLPLQVLGAVSASSTGVVTYTFTVPTGLSAGAHSLALSDGTTSAVFPFQITSATVVAPVVTALPFTGAPETGSLILIGAGAVATGGALLLASKRRANNA